MHHVLSGSKRNLNKKTLNPRGVDAGECEGCVNCTVQLTKQQRMNNQCAYLA